jgi:hypothetical protein
MGLLMESIESLLKRDTLGGFRGVQSKSLVDIIQLECLSQSSCVLKISSGAVEGRIWIQNGEVIDAELPDLTAEPAFQRILSWKTGSFEIQTPDAERSRTIFTSYQGLLLNTAQVLDEAASVTQVEGVTSDTKFKEAEQTTSATLLAELAQYNGVEFVLALNPTDEKAEQSWGLENTKPVAEWTRQTLEQFRDLGEFLEVGAVQQIIGTGPHRKVALGPCGHSELCVGFPASFPPEQLRETMKNVLTKWAS